MLKSRITAFTLLLTAGLLASTASAQSIEHKPVIGVTTFENRSGCHSANLGPGLTDLFVTELMKTGRYKIIERDDLNDLVDEIELGRSGYLDRKSSVRKGHVQGLEYLAIGKVTNFGESENAYGWLVGYHTREAYVRIDFRIVDATTGEVVYSGLGEGADSTKGLAFTVSTAGPAAAPDLTSAAFLKSQIGRATVKAI